MIKLGNAIQQQQGMLVGERIVDGIIHECSGDSLMAMGRMGHDSPDTSGRKLCCPNAHHSFIQNIPTEQSSVAEGSPQLLWTVLGQSCDKLLPIPGIGRRWIRRECL